MAKKYADIVEKIAVDLLAGTDLELVDVEYVKERDWYLRVYIDKPGGIEVDDCQELSERLEKILDEQDIIKESYILEVSSPGLDRVLKKERDFIREQGKVVDVTLYEPLDGNKILTGTLTGFDEGRKCIILDEKQELPLDKAAQVRLHIEF